MKTEWKRNGNAIILSKLGKFVGRNASAVKNKPFSIYRKNIESLSINFLTRIPKFNQFYAWQINSYHINNTLISAKKRQRILYVCCRRESIILT